MNNDNDDDPLFVRQAGGLSEEDDTIPIRIVESATFCPRQAWYRLVAGDDPINVHMQRGLNRHEIFDQQQPVATQGERIWRHVAVFAPLLGVSGVLDELSITDERLVITEYKTSHRSAFIWDGVLMQLAVQHLALREHAASSRWHGPALPPAPNTLLRVYYTDSRRTREVSATPDLDQRARESVARYRAVLAHEHPPAGIVGPRCRECQHEPMCLPFQMPTLREALQ